MKNLILILLLIPIFSKSQCVGSCEPAKIIPALIIDNSIKQYESGFTGFGAQAGIWINWLGFTVGGVESKVNQKTPATREAIFTMHGRYLFFDQRLQVSPFFSIGTNNYQDVGIRAGWYVLKSAYVGAVVSRTMHYGISIMVSIEKN